MRGYYNFSFLSLNTIRKGSTMPTASILQTTCHLLFTKLIHQHDSVSPLQLFRWMADQRRQLYITYLYIYPLLAERMVFSRTNFLGFLFAGFPLQACISNQLYAFTITQALLFCCLSKGSKPAFDILHDVIHFLFLLSFSPRPERDLIHYPQRGEDLRLPYSCFPVLLHTS